MKGTTEIENEWDALGITPETFACMAVFDENDAREFVWRLAQEHVECRVAIDPDTVGSKRPKWHIAVRGGLRYSTIAWIATLQPIRDSDILRCVPYDGKAHIMPDKP